MTWHQEIVRIAEAIWDECEDLLELFPTTEKERKSSSVRAVGRGSCGSAAMIS